MKYFLSTLVAFTLLGISASAQSNYKPGYYLSLQGDTVRGLIDNREWSLTPETIDFKADANTANRQHLSPANIKGFAVQGDDIYQSYGGKVTIDNLGNTNGRDTSVMEKNIFLKLLTRGDKVALFEYTDRIKKRFFIMSAGTGTAELIYRSYQQNDQTIDERTYRKQLSIIALQNNKLSDEVNSLIQRTDYDDDALTKVVKQINDVTENTSLTTSKGRSFGFYAGIYANVMMYRTDAGIKEAGAPNHTSVLPSVAAGVNVYVNPRTRQVVLRVEGGLAMSHYSGEYKSLQSPYNDVVFKFNQMNVYVAPQILYHFYNGAGVKAFIGAGMQGYLSNYSGREFHSADGSESQLATQPFGYFLKTGTAILFKAGFVVNQKIEINGGYTIQSDIAQDAYYAIRASGAHIGVNYLF